MTPERVAHIGDVISMVVAAYGKADARTAQSQAGVLGFSDLGHCRMKAVLMTKGVPQSDSKPIGKAQRGTAAHIYLGEALEWGMPGWMIDTRANPLPKVTARFPSGFEVSGTPDAVDVPNNGVVDLKSKADLLILERVGESTENRYQRHAQVMGCLDAGWLDPDVPLYVGNWFMDPNDYGNSVFLADDYDPAMTHEIDEWLCDVRDGVLAEEPSDELRDVSPPVCEKICEWFTVCRGGMLPAKDGDVMFDDVNLIEATFMYDEGRAEAKVGKEKMEQAKITLDGANGIAEKDDRLLQVRFTHANGDASSGSRISVTEVKARP